MLLKNAYNRAGKLQAADAWPTSDTLIDVVDLNSAHELSGMLGSK
jgi:hypothetical protein